MSDYYKILNVDKNSPQEDIKKSYRALAMKYHPDHTNGDKESEEKFKQISEAYDVLSNPEKKQDYDNPQRDFLKDIFSNMGGMGGFGGGNPFHRQRTNVVREDVPKRGMDTQQVINANISDFILGGKVELNFDYFDLCNECNGNGGKNFIQCKECGGSGAKTIMTRRGNTTFSSMEPCTACKGRGFSYEKICDKCNGDCKIPKSKKLMIDIPVSLKDGMGIRMVGASGKGTNGAPNGDLLVKVNMRYPNVSELTEEQISLLRSI